MNHRTEDSYLERIATILILIAVKIITLTAASKYPVSESNPINEQTRECFYKGETGYFRYYSDDCFYIYGRMTGSNERIPSFHQIWNFTGCIIMADLDKLESIPLASVVNLHANNDFCEYKYSLMVYGNENLKRISLRKNMGIKQEEIFIRANEKLQPEGVTGAPFTVDIGTPQDCTMKMALKRTDCSALVGDLLYPANDEAIEVWNRIHKVYGTVTVNGIGAMSLSMLRNLVIDGWQQRVVRIINNRELRHIAEILTMTITGPEPHFWFHNNTSFCHPVNIRKKLEAKLGTKISWDERCLTRCPGGSVNAEYLDDLDENCNVVGGNLVIEGLQDMPSHLDKLAQIERISGRLIVKENRAVRDLSFLPYLKEIGSSGKTGLSFEVVDNVNFVMKGLDTLEKINGDVRIISEKETDVSNAVQRKLAGVTSGTASFFARKCQGGKVTETYLNSISEFCKETIGDLRIEGLKELPAGIEKLSHFKKIGGRLVVKNNEAVEDLSFLSSLEEIYNSNSKSLSLEVIDNRDFVLRGLDAIKKIKGKALIVTEKMEDVSVDVREHIKGVCDDGAQFSARQCRGGMVDEQFLRELDKFCNVITGNLFIRGFRREPKGLDNLRQVKKVRGRVVVKDNAAIKDLSFLSNMEEIDGNHHGDASLHVFDNRNFGMRGLYSIRKIRGDVVIKTEKKEDVPEDMKNRLISVTDGSVKFLTASDDMRRPDGTTETSEILTEATEHTLDEKTTEDIEGVLEKLISTTTKDVEREGTTTSEDTDQMPSIFPEKDSTSDKITMSLKKSNFKKERTGHLSVTSRILVIVGVSVVVLFLLAGLIILVIVIVKSVSKKKQRGSNESAYVKSQSIKPSRSETNQESLAKPSRSETNQESLAKPSKSETNQASLAK